MENFPLGKSGHNSADTLHTLVEAKKLAYADLLRYVVEKGSVTLDGVSLTVKSVDAHSFEVSLIPETLERTNLGSAAPGRRVNLEVDVLAKYVEKLLSNSRPDLEGTP